MARKPLIINVVQIETAEVGFDCDVWPARVERLDGARFRLTVFPPLPVTRSGEPHADAAALMARVNLTLEAWIRDRPEQWLWVHRRWPD
jgi:KDO2-lipid IV(A) lauroyltransferase